MSGLWEWVGRFHPLVLHLPIGVYCFAFVWQYLFPRKLRSDDGFLTGLFVFGSGSAVLSFFLGWLLSQSGDYAPEEVEWHKWTAAVFSGLSFLLLFFWKQRGRHLWMRRVYHVNFWLMMTLLAVTGHLGGSLTHGAGYLSISSVSDDAIKTDSSIRLPLTDSSEVAVYTAMVAPVLEQKCVACHQQKKMKGGLRMDGFDWLMKGGKSGVVVRSGDVANSELIRRMLLPLEDDKHMPPKGKKQLSEEEIALLHWWVMKGADTLTTVRDVSVNDTIRVFLSGSGKKEMGVDTLPLISFPDSMALRQLKARGYGVRPLVSGSGWLDITAINVEKLEAGDAPLLQKLAPQIWQMNLSGHELPESFTNVLEVLIHTRRLDLRNAELSAGIRKKLDRLEALEYLNITGTDCTDADLLPLLSLKNLRQVYGWESGVSAASVQTFLQKRPDIKLDLGGK